MLPFSSHQLGSISIEMREFSKMDCWESCVPLQDWYLLIFHIIIIWSLYQLLWMNQKLANVLLKKIIMQVFVEVTGSNTTNRELIYCCFHVTNVIELFSCEFCCKGKSKLAI